MLYIESAPAFIKIINAQRLPLTGEFAPNNPVELQIRSSFAGWGQPGLWKRAEGQKYAPTGMFRSTVSRPRPSSRAISPVCLPWNAATDSNSSLEQRGIIWKRVAKSTRRLSVIPPLLWALWIRRVFNASKTRQRLSDAGFNQTFGRLCVQGQEPPSQRNHLERRTVGDGSHFGATASVLLGGG